MLELRCEACGRANAVREEARLDETRCAECSGALDLECPVRYVVSEGGRERGPCSHRELIYAVAMGTLTPDVLLSEDGGPWFRAGEREDLFPRARAVVPGRVRARPAPKTRSPHLRSERARPPGPVQTLIVLETLLGVLLLILAFALFVVLSALGVGEVLWTALLVGLVGVGHFALAHGLRQRSVLARNLQLLLAGAVGLAWLASGLAGAGAGATLLGLLFVAIPFLLLLGEEGRAWFAAEDARD